MEMAKPETMARESAPPSIATATPQLSSVEDLERRLKMIGNSPDAAAAAAAAAPPVAQMKPPPQVAPPAAAAAAPSMSGKTALLARIQAAKAKTKNAQAHAKPPPPMAAPPPTDFLSDFDAPSLANDPPPAYETNFLPPPPPTTGEAPGLMDDLSPPAMHFAPPPPLNNSLAPPPPPMEYSLNPPPPAFLAPPAASAPMFEDLQMQQQHHGGEMNLLDMPSAMMPPPPPSTNAAPEIDEDILAALDPAERDAILEEQRKIMEQIENEKNNDTASSAAARAMAFDQRSGVAVARVAGDFETAPSASRTKSKKSSSKFSSKASAKSAPGMVDLGHGEQVPLHGRDETQKAIQDGNALIVQCLNCQNWMQVTKDATLMFCPTCQVVSPVLADEAATSEDMEAAAQLSADAQLAEKLQAEEYASAGGGKKKTTAASSNNKKTAKLEKGQAVEQSWYDWLMGSEEATKPPPPARGSAEIRPRGLVAASTGEESYGRGSYDESERLMGSGGGGARMAESKGMFACVADAVGTAVNTMVQDEEGNVHGVDSSGLLAMPNVSRQRE